ncbi:hypothetical protein Taro_016257 [Colocasia esculenta]|uniref:Ion transport domain-containing protein n=1 Tax=Colocasia esculenta TaxID=4460 RepID=A0A843UK67_COLES|nr:hypothetical protein [Colocasia esculenta]
MGLKISSNRKLPRRHMYPCCRGRSRPVPPDTHHAPPVRVRKRPRLSSDPDKETKWLYWHWHSSSSSSSGRAPRRGSVHVRSSGPSPHGILTWRVANGHRSQRSSSAAQEGGGLPASRVGGPFPFLFLLFRLLKPLKHVLVSASPPVYSNRKTSASPQPKGGPVADGGEEKKHPRSFSFRYLLQVAPTAGVMGLVVEVGGAGSPSRLELLGLERRGKLSFQDWNSERSVSSECILPGRNKRPQVSMSKISQRISEWVSGVFKNIFHCLTQRNSSAEEWQSRRKILDPQGLFLQKWNKIFVLSCVLAVSVDPLFFYIPVVNDKKKCLDLDSKLEITASVLRSFTDIFYVLHIIFQFHTGFIAPSSRVFGRGVLVEDPSKIARRYLSSYFIVDILAVLPLPQVIILIIIPKMRGSAALNAKNMLRFVVIFQYVPRLVRIRPLYREVTRTSGIITQTAWAGAALNLFLYMLASHVFGALWYLLSIERQDTCWRRACNKGNDCIKSLYCGKEEGKVLKDFLNSSCSLADNSTAFDFGIYLPALQNIVQSTDFPEKLFYCFWWGLQNLSSLGQNLKTSTFVGEICFAVFISISGLVNHCANHFDLFLCI